MPALSSLTGDTDGSAPSFLRVYGSGIATLAGSPISREVLSLCPALVELFVEEASGHIPGRARRV